MGSSSKWRKARLALGCIQVPPTLDDDNSSSSTAINLNHTTTTPNVERRRLSDAAPFPVSSSNSSLSPIGCQPLTPTPSSSGLRLSSKSSKRKTCAICLNAMIPGHGHAIFTAECSHSFHFNCITSNVKHGNRICPVCRAKWKEIPFQSQSSELPVKLTTNAIGRSRDDSWMSALHPVPVLPPDANQLMFHASEPDTFDDDDPIEHQDVGVGQSVTSDSNESSSSSSSSSSMGRVEVKAYPEVAAIPKSTTCDDFTILIHLKAPMAKVGDHASDMQSGSTHSRAPVDLVTVLDVSGSMAGTKLALLKRAMGFVIQHLGPHDRLSVIAFSSAARRVLPLRRMTDNGRRQALQAVNSLSSNGGTNIAEGLKKGAKVMLDRKSKNPVSSIILLSDGQDTYTTNSRADYKSLLPVSIQRPSQSQVPVHTFGFGTDHDSVSMHSISEASGGTFSFIEAESVVQDAFAQCMGGLLSVVAQELKVEVESAYARVHLGSIKAGSYHTKMMADARNGVINVGDLYAEEERNFLVNVNVPRGGSLNEMPLLRVSCLYKDPITNESVRLHEAEEVKIQRPETEEVEQVVSMEVDRQRNRLNAAEAMSRAMSAAEQCDLGGAVSILDSCRKTLSESVSAKAGDPLCVALGNELKEMQDRMANRQVYEASGRAYVLSGLSSHSWQRATARGDSNSSTNLSQAYQTSNMAHMITRSQTMVFGALSTHPPPPPVRPPRSLSTRSNAR